MIVRVGMIMWVMMLWLGKRHLAVHQVFLIQSHHYLVLSHYHKIHRKNPGVLDHCSRKIQGRRSFNIHRDRQKGCTTQ